MQHCVVENILEDDYLGYYMMLNSALQYLKQATTALHMPEATILSKLWEVITDTHVSSNYLLVGIAVHCILHMINESALHMGLIRDNTAKNSFCKDSIKIMAESTLNTNCICNTQPQIM